MSRRQFLTQLGGAAALGALDLFAQPRPAMAAPGSLADILRGALIPQQQGENLHAEISQLLLSIRITLALKNFELARQQAEQLKGYSLRDPNWFTYSESFQIAVILSVLTDPHDRRAWASANWGVLEAYSGSMYGNMAENQRAAARSAQAVLLADSAGPALIAPESHGRAASLLLVTSAMAPGPERVAWAQLGRRETLKYGAQALTDWSVDNITPRMATAGLAVAGDWKAASSEYDKVLRTSAGAMERVEQDHRGNRYAGLVETIAGVTTLESEAATAFAMNGQHAKAIETLERARRNTLSATYGDPTAEGSHPPAVELEDRLTRAGVVVVQPVTSLIGAFVLVSLRRKGKLERVTLVDFEPGGAALFARMISSSSSLFFKDGLGPVYQRTRKSGRRDLRKKMIEYVERAARDANELSGASIRKALLQAKVSGTDDVLVILPANLALLPIAISRASPADTYLGDRFQLRFADSLRSAWSAQQGAARSSGATGLVVVAADTRASGLPDGEFEVDCVSNLFPASNRRRVTPDRTTTLSLGSLEGAAYWHLTSHAAWNYGEPGKSGLALTSRQTTTVADILALRMRSPPRLVFLSACETALIDVEKDLNHFVGLPAALLAAGSAAAVGSLWPVDDAATALLTARFYDEHVSARRTPADSLRRAQRWIRTATSDTLLAYVSQKVAQGQASVADAAELSATFVDLPGTTLPYAAPYYWGGFQVFGA